MKIATYNVWNETSNLDIRTEDLIQEIISLDADIIGLQEVRQNFWENIIKYTNYTNHVFRMLKHRNDGLAILSKYPIEKIDFLYDSQEFDNSFALNITIREHGVIFSITNVHLPWDSMAAREKQTVAINNFANKQKEVAEYFILLGDFNCSYRSSVHNFLIGEQTLLNCEANLWYDLAEVHASRSNYIIMPTLDFVRNPRWQGNDNKQIPVACDRIYLMDNAKAIDFGVKTVSNFGTNISQRTGLSPSDHYGVIAEVNFA